MKQHQKCFSLKYPRTGKLANRFLLVTNLVAEDGGKEIIAGNEKVIRARLSDAKFFWEQDLKKPLDEMAVALGGITFHEKLGSQKERVERVAELAFQIAGAVDANPEDARRAAQLAKADLVSGMVGEFPELQGLMGRYYAEVAKAKPEIARAIELHYKPKGPTDTVPKAADGDAVAIALALADKLDTLVGFWAIGEKPTGSGDPYQLRRAALGVIRIVLENDLRLPLFLALAQPFSRVRKMMHSREFAAQEEAVEVLYRVGFDAGGMERMKEEAFRKKAQQILADLPEIIRQDRERCIDLLAFFADRLKVHLRDKGARHDLIDAVFSLGGQDDLALIVKRVEALGEFLKSDDGANLLTGVRRAINILRDEEKKDKKSHAGAADARAAARAPGEGAACRHPEGEEGHGCRHQRRELRRRHARSGRAARACRCLLRQGDRQRKRGGRRCGLARQSPRAAVGDPRRHPQRGRLLQDRRLICEVLPPPMPKACLRHDEGGGRRAIA